MAKQNNLGEGFERLAGVMARLRSMEGGCPWDLEQTPETLARHLLEEAYESVDAIESSDWEHLGEELGDLLLQVVFQSRIAEEHGRFDLADVVDGITTKLERRHPHIFGSVEAPTAEQVSVNWDRIKRQEEGDDAGAPIKMPGALPAVLAALKIQGQAARAGFDWERADGVLEKLDEEVGELKDAVSRGAESGEVEDELGDLLFTVVNLARHLDVDPELSLRRTCVEFVRRYTLLEEEARRAGGDLGSMTLDEKEALWQGAKGKGVPGEEE